MLNEMEQKRAFVADLYPGPNWKKKVKGMPDTQVFAIYMREQGKLPKTEKPKESGNDDIPF